MKETRPAFTQDHLLKRIKKSFEQSLQKHKIPEKISSLFTNADCLMAGLAVFTFKYPSLLKFDQSYDEPRVKQNLKNLFGLTSIPCDTYMRERLDEINAQALTDAFKDIFRLLQRGKVIEHFAFLRDTYLVSLDGTGMFSSTSVHCENCCVKNHKNGTKTYHHQALTAAMVHPDQKVVIPFAHTPILKQDGATKNDCEQNALKRWLKGFRKDHPHLKIITLLDALHANGPTVNDLKQHGCHFLIVCKEADHQYLYDWINKAEPGDAPAFTIVSSGSEITYQYMLNVPLSGQADAPQVNVIRVVEKNRDNLTTRVWITDLQVDHKNIIKLSKGARTRWKIENEVHNTLKNQGYEFEHNFGHGNKYLNQVFAHLMLLAFMVDQCLQKLNKRFCQALEKSHGKKYLWRTMLVYLNSYMIPDFETLYAAIFKPPDISLDSVQKFK
jgi:hypothetical protein